MANSIKNLRSRGLHRDLNLHDALARTHAQNLHDALALTACTMRWHTAICGRCWGKVLLKVCLVLPQGVVGEWLGVLGRIRA
jgi:hypothetical protein